MDRGRKSFDRWSSLRRLRLPRCARAGFTHRFAVTDGASVIVLPPDVGFEIPYRLLDADGQVLSEGTSQP